MPEYFQDTFVEALKNAYASPLVDVLLSRLSDGAVPRYKEMHPTEPRETGMVSRMVNETHAKRVKRLIDETKGTIVFGGEVDVEAKYVAPTLVKDVKGDDSLMSE